MKTNHKKVIGGLLIGLLIATVGAALATGQNDDMTNDTTNHVIPKRPFEGRGAMMRIGMFGSELKDEQQTELEELMTSLRQQKAKPDEIRIAIQEKLNEFGVFDTRLESEIAQTEQRLTVLNRQKELREEGLSWDEINNIIEDEFDLDNTPGIDWDTIGVRSLRRGPFRSPREVPLSEDSY